MKCLSLWQPWATLIAIGAKRIETRSWPTNYRGPISIHAAKRWAMDQVDICDEMVFLKALTSDAEIARRYVVSEAEVESGCMNKRFLPLGCIVGTAYLDSCIKITWQFAATLSDQERAFGNYEPGRWAWILNSVKPLPKPIPWRGAQGLFEVPDGVLAGAKP